MKVLGLLLTLTCDSEVAAPDELPGLTLGDCTGRYLAATLEGDTTAEVDEQLTAIERTPGVALVQVVSVFWDQPDGDEARRLRGRQKIRSELHSDSLSGGSR